MPLTVAAQKVQRSAHGNAYARWKELARRVVTSLTGTGCAPPQDVPRVVRAALTHVRGPGNIAARVALSQRGVPYSWGGGDASGPTYGIGRGADTVGFDCSGLAEYAWAKAGVNIGGYTGVQWRDGVHVPFDELRPGDLVFFTTNPSDPATIHHVGIYLADGFMVHAPNSDEAVHVERFTDSEYYMSQYIGAVRPVLPSS